MTLADLFAAQVARTPEAVALVAGGERWTYRELDRRAARVARHLRELGVGPEVRVGICLRRSADLPAALLGVLKAGGAYVPLDPAYPEERLRFLLADSAAPVVLTEERLLGRLDWIGTAAQRVCLDRLPEDEGGEEPPANRAGSGNLAYLIYTSGSTGRPKGVAIEHRSAVAMVEWARRTFPADELAGMLASTSINFDLSVFELFVPLACGGKVILAENALELPALPAAGEVTFVNTVPSAMAELVRTGGVPRSVLAVGLAGEPLPQTLAGQIHALGTVRRLYNLYGPSEDTTYSTWTAVTKEEDGPPSIGRPIDGGWACLLDAAGKPAAEGEILLGGTGLARGYLGRPELTAERFVPDPFGELPGGRLYRTGDLARLRPDGGLDFLGRLDHQVKIRGFRIELGEIETWLGRHPGVRQAVVVAREDRPGDKRLVAYFVPEDSAALGASDLRDHLRESLPEHMVPSSFVRLDAFPLTPNGKIDRQALPAPAAEGTGREGFVAPRTALERHLAGIWGEVLGLDAETGQVGSEDDFFALGGHSLHATQVLSRVRDAFGVALAPRQLFAAPTVAGLAALLEAAGPADGAAAIPPLTRFPREPRMLPSFAQERLWFVEQFAPGTATYNVPAALRFHGPLDAETLERSLNEVVRRHEALRTALVAIDGKPFQVIAPELRLELSRTDLSGARPEEREGEALRRAEEEARRPFDLARLPLLRAHLFRLAEEEHLLLLNLHHVISDDWSLWVLVRELGAVYRAFSAGQPSPLPELDVQYPDFALWQRGWLQGEVYARQLGYWKRQLAGAPAALDLPLDRPRPQTVTFPGKRHDFALPGELAQRLAALSREQGATPFMTLLAAFGVQLGRISRQDDVLIGSPVANRNWAGVEGLIGFFTNTLVLRVSFAGRPDFRGLLARVRDAALDGSTNQDLPFESLATELAVERQLGRQVLFQVMFALQNAPRPPREIAPGLTADLSELDTGTAKVDLSLLLWETDGGLAAAFEYNTDLLDESTVARLAGHYTELLAGIAADPGRPVSELPLLTGAEERQVLGTWNDTGAAPGWQGSVGELFEDQARRTPDAPALALGEEALTYGELAARTGRLARRLRALGVGPEVLVGLCAERSIGLIEGLLAIWRAGGACVPIHPSYPRERMSFLLEDTRVPVLITQQRLAEALPVHTAQVVLLDSPDAGDEMDEEWGGSLPEPGLPEPGNLAYVIYTSGSTGRPKGVGVPHGAFASHCAVYAALHDFGPADRVLQFSELSFDASLEQIVPSLLAGAALVLRGEELWGSEETIRRIERTGATVLDLPTALLHQMLRRLAEGEDTVDAHRVRLLTTGGEAMPPQTPAFWRRSPFSTAELHNRYGPTEAVVSCTFFPVPPEPGWIGSASAVSIGRPIPGRKVYILDAAGLPIPVGVPGEIHLGGPLLARGYLGLPALTAERFVPDPFGGEPGGRLYRTGDLARWAPHGDIEFLGRLDHQVKVRGFRIELGEIEVALGRHPAVEEGVAALSGAVGGERRLVAWLVPAGEVPPTAGELRSFLRESLPEHMVPAAFLVLPSFPRTTGGKVDRRALPSPEEALRTEAGGAATAPRTPLEEVLAGLWAELLGVERVGIHESFFELGGHSLLATQLISRIRRLGIELPLRRLFEQPTVAGLAELIDQQSSGAAAAPPLVPMPRPVEPPLSFAQERLWFLDQLEPGRPTYNIPLALRLAGELDVPALQQSLGEIARRHEVLRTRLVETEKDRPVQRIDPATPFRLPRIDLFALPPPVREAEAERLIAADALRPFDLAVSVWRAALLRLEEREHALVLGVHHAAADGWSFGVLLRELAELYRSAVAGTSPRLSALPVQYADFALWQRQWLQGEALEAQVAWWHSALAGLPPALDLPADRPRPALRSQHGGTCHQAWPRELGQGLARLARAEGVTLFMVLLAGFQTLLSRASRQEDLAVGTPIAGRNRVEIEPLIGLFVNTLALRTDLSGDPAFRSLLARVREATLGAYTHQDVPFEKLVQELHPERSLSHTPLIQVLLGLNTGASLPELPGLSLREVEATTRTAKFELTLFLDERETGLDASFEYSADRFDGATALRLLKRLQVLLEGAVADPGSRLSDLPLLSAAEQAELEAWGAGGAGEAQGETLAALFEAQVARTPEAEALVAGTERWSYSELDRRAGRLAGHLQSLGVGPEVRVGICLGRTADLLVAVLGVLKAGGAYVPLDPAYPEERLRYLLADSGAPVVLSHESLLPRIAWIGSAARVVCLDRLSGLEVSPVAEPRSGSGHLAYLIYTSGSTGRPKGVAIEHRSATALVAWALRSFAPEELAGMLASTSVNFDLSVFEMFVPLACGGKVILAGNALELPSLPAADEVTFVNTVPSAMAELVRTGGVPRPVRAVGLAGEPLPRSLADQIHAPGTGRRLYNLYGPSEDTTYSTWTAVEPGEVGAPSIGRPIAGSRVDLLDAGFSRVAAGWPGELCLAGAGLARGYLNAPGQTAARFVPDPFATEPGARLYRTGDLARWSPRGDLEFLGRLDHQVKVRGFRVELGEIEVVLGRHPAVAEVVAVLSGAENDRRLVAYLVPAGEAVLPVGELRSFLREHLPEHMVPAVFVMLPSFPRTASGKIDRKALPDPEGPQTAPGGGPKVPRTPLEEVLTGIWAEILGIDRIGVHDNFFDLGGHSLLATQVLSRLRRLLGADLPLRRMFERPTVAGLAELLDRWSPVTGTADPADIADTAPPLVPVPRDLIEPPLSFAQERLWFLEKMDPGRSGYNIALALRLSGELDVPALQWSLGEIVRRHEILRTRLIELEHGPVQRIDLPASIALPRIDLSGLPRTPREAEVECRLTADSLEPFDLGASLWRARLLRLEEREHALLLCLHHSAADGWSLRVLFQEMAELYRSAVAGLPSRLPELPVQYADFAVWQRRWLQGEALESQLGWWRETLAGAPPVLDLPADRPRPEVLSERGRSCATTWPRELVEGLEKLARVEGATLFMVVLAGFQALLSRVCRQEDVTVGSPIAGRNRVEIEPLIGLFVNTLVLRTDLSGGPSFRELLARVRESTLGAYAHQDLPLEKLVQELQPERSLSHTPLFQVLLVLQNTGTRLPELPGLALSTVEAETTASQFELSLVLEESGTGLDASLEYSTDRFDDATARRLLEHMRVLLAGIVADPGRPASELPLLTAAEERQVLGTWNDMGAAPAWRGSVGELFEDQARRTPDAPALALGAEAFTYGELAARTGRLARRLRALGVGPEVLVGLCAERSIGLIEGLIAIWRAGGACLPIHPTYPRERMGFLLEDTRVPVLITQRRLTEALPAHAAQVVLLDSPDAGGEADEERSGSLPAPGSLPEPGNLAYVIYTSGSTGRPKGVGVPHGAFASHCAVYAAFHHFSPADRVLQFSELSFDAALEQIVPPFLAGAALVLRGEELWGSEETIRAIETTGATVLDLPTALLHQVLRRLAEGEDTVDARRVRLLLTGGEAMPPQTPDFWRRSPLAAAELQNGYGPTEAVISGTFFPVPSEPGWIGSGGAVSIGRPIPGRKLYILDAAGLPIPIGVPGEIHLGGPLLARGYLGLSALTAERFVPDPFGAEPGGRLYRTGDLARWAPHGDIEFLGRLDHQVKVRGFRIELGEIEAVLGRHPAVAEGVVALARRAGGEPRLVAWLIPAGEVPPTASELRSFLRESLPDHMVPAAFLVLPSFPRTTGGKVDRRALPPLEEALRAEAEGAAAAPRTPVEEVLAGLWAELLGVERVGIHESFFELGGHSLLATQLISRIRHVLGADIPLRALFRHPTVAGLAAEVRGGEPPRPIPRVSRDGDLPLSFAQERLWFLEQLNPGTAAFNITIPLHLDGRLDARVLAACFDELVRRHEPLRSRFVVRNGRPGQVIEPAASRPLPLADLAGLPPEARSREVNRLGLAELRRPFDLARGPLFRAALLRLEAEDHVLLLSVHHAVADGWAVGVITRELVDLYQAFLAGRPSPLPELPIQPADFAVWQREELAGERLERELAWWRQQIGPQIGETSVQPVLPTDRPRPQSPDLRGRRRPVEIPAARLEPLKRLGRRQGATLFMSLLAVLAAQLHRYSGAGRIPVGTPIANRNRTEIEGLTGMFINTLVLAVDLSAVPSFTDLLARVREVTLGAYEHQDLPYEKLVQALQPDRKAPQQGLFQVFFALDNTPAPAVELPGLSFRAFDLEGAESMTANFDLSVLLGEMDGGISGSFSYAVALFDPPTVQRMVEHFGILLDGAAADPEHPLTELPFLSPAERHQLLWEGSPSHAASPAGEPAPAVASVAAAPRKENRAELEARVAQRRSGLSASKRDLLEQRLRGKTGKGSGGSGAPRIPRRAESGPAPLSFAQERLWFLDRLEPGSAAYNIPTALRLEGDLHLPALAAALAEVRRRHEVLRATFGERDGKPFQLTAPLGAAALPQVDLEGLEAEAREAEVRRLVADDAARPFDLERGPLLRTTLVRLGARSHVLLLSAHHIVFDAWSSGVFTREMGTLYAAFAAGALSSLPELEIQYADFAAWQAEWLRGEVLETQLAYWRQSLADAPAALELPTDRPRPAVVSPRGGARATSWGTPLAHGLGQLAKESGATLFMVALAGFQALLSRSTGQHDVCVGTPVAGRNRLEIEPLIGFFVNTLVLRTDLSGDPSFRELVARVREVTLGAYAHQDLPFERLVQEVNPERSLARTPLFQVVFSLQNATSETLALPGLALRGMADDTPVAKFDLTLVLEESEHGLRAVLEHSADLFDGTTAQRLLEHLGVLLTGAAENPERRLSELPLLRDEERAQVVWEWNATAREQREHPRGQTLAGLFAAQLERTPDAVALVAGTARWTYRELNLQAARLAAGLRALGVGPEVRVGIHLDRSPEMVAALLGVLAAGGAYVPLDPDYPEERLAFLLADSAAPVVLCAEHRAERLARIAPGVRIVRLEEALEAKARPERVNRATAGSLAYLIYTSGSTGRPKGVAIEHRQAVAMVQWALDTFAAGDLAGMLASTSINFDLSVFELFVPLACGGKVVLAGNALELPALSAAAEVTFVNTVPSALSELLHGGGLPPSVTAVGLAGEPLPRSLAQRIHALGTVRRLYNLYGPSESTTYSTWTLLNEDDAQPPTLGRPIANTGIYLLDAGLAPVGIGTPGELYVGGAGVARGYHGRPELTAERFVPDPFGMEPGARLYRTGDLARWGRTGEIELLGRVDFQVKLRGFRIELGEIEAALGRHPGVRQTVVVLRPAEQRLVAYVVPSAEPVPEITAGDLRGFLRERLPGHMVPAAFVTLAALPLSPNGKVDRRRLPEPDGGPGEGGETYLAPRTPVEEVLAAIWSEVLGVDRIGVRDSFFERGGHSLLATRVIARMRATLGVELPLKTIFEAPTVADLALAVARVQRAGTAGTGPEAPLRPAPRKGALRLSFAQERLWFLDQLEPGSSLYNLPMAFLLEGELRVPALAAACREIVRRHEVLRSVFPSVSGEPVQVIRPAAEPILSLSLPLVDLGGLPAERRESAARDLVRQEVRRPFDLARGPLFRALLVRLDERAHAFCAGMHHIVSDGGSLQIFERELAALYTAAPLPDLPLQYADFAAWQREWLQGAVLEGQIGYWRERLAGAPPVLDLPLDRSRPKELGQRGASRSLDLPAHLAHEIGALGRAEAATPFMIVLAAFAALLARSAAGTDILVGAPVAGRDRLELEPLIGLFVNTLVLRTDLAGDPDVRELLRRARQTVLDAHAHQDLPFERLVEELQPQRSLAHTPLFQVLLVQAPRGESSGLPGLAVRAFGAESGTAKFDLTLALDASEQGLGLSLEYRTDLFDATTAQRLLAHLSVLLAGMAREPRSRLSDLPLLTAEERAQVVTEWNATGLALPGEETLDGLFEAQAGRTPDAVALVAGEVRWSYRELDRRTGGLARRLRALGVGPEVRVGIHLDRSPEMVIALLAVLRAGGAYVPLDPGYPGERLAFLVADSAAAVVLAGADRAEALAAIAPGVRLVRVVRVDEPSADETPQPIARPAGNGHMAYLIYTSGSTGRPKGVAIEHRSAVAMVRWALASFAPGDLAGMLASTSINFDLSVFELFVPLACGARVHLAANALELPSLPAASEVTFVNTVPSAMAELVRTGGLPPSVTAVGLAGEPLPLGLVRQLYASGTVQRVYNLYGPSEGTTYSTWALLDPASERAPSIGRPVANTEIYLLDAGFAPVGVGSTGELYVGGAGVARGYLGRPELTAERFLPDPFSGWSGARLYRTGDLARWQADGEIEFLGRADFQVKVRGFRIELGEIEAVLGRHSGVRETVVTMAESQSGMPGDRRVVAYVAVQGEPDGLEAPAAGDLRRFLQERLPDHMVPTAWVLLDALPRTPNGKVDRKALPAPDAAAGPESSFVAPRNPVEEVLAGIWAEVLGRDEVGVRDDFFTLGGHSLLATRIIAQVKAAFRVEIGLQSLFREPTVEQMAAALLADGGERIERTAELLLELAATPDEDVESLLGEDDPAAAGLHR